jgi:hypothetical protein
MFLGVRCGRIALILLASLCLTLSGCGSKVNKANAEKIKAGMTEKEVLEILGPPTDSQELAVPGIPGMPSGGMPGGLGMPKKVKTCNWRDGTKAITIQFMDDKVVSTGTMNL